MESNTNMSNDGDGDCIWPFKIENITVVQAPLLKIYYWESLDIDGLNQKLSTGQKELTHSLFIPTAQINSCQLRIVFWFKDISTTGLDIELKRKQNCDCVAFPTRVGFNQFRKLYHCPHRHLVNATQEKSRSKPGELIALSFTVYFYFLGEHKLTYELSCNNKFVLTLEFFVDIVCFDVQKCLITKELIPVDMSESRRLVQALWVRNITMQDLKFSFCTKSRGLKIINGNLTIPRQSVWPLMVEFRPTGPVDELKITQTFDNKKTIHNISATGYLGNCPLLTNMNLQDNDCSYHRFIITPMILEFDVGQDEERTLMVNIHNYEQKCVEFHWQNYVINNMFSITYEPPTFRLKPHHSKLCIVQLRSFERPLHFARVPLVLEVHRIFDRSTRIAKDLLSEIESIDDPKWKQESYMEHVLLQVDLKINFKPIEPLNFICPPSSSISTQPQELTTNGRNDNLTIFEKLFWEYLSQSNFMRPDKKQEKNHKMNYSEVFEMVGKSACQSRVPSPRSDMNTNNVLKLVSTLIVDALRDVSKNWIFVPPETYERPL